MQDRKTGSKVKDTALYFSPKRKKQPHGFLHRACLSTVRTMHLLLTGANISEDDRILSFLSISVTVLPPRPEMFPASKQLFLPFLFFESGKHKGITDQQRTLDQHAVRGQEGQLLILGHIRQLLR